MKQNTIDYYDENASGLYQRYNLADMNKLHKILDKYTTASDKVLDIGFGSGRDLLHLKKRGISGWGIDGSASFIDIFKQDYQSFSDRIHHSVLPEIALPKDFKNFFTVIY